MPLYEYTCEGCNAVFDAYNTIDNRREQHCLECDSPTPCELLISAPTIVGFQSGWFEHIADDPIYIETPQQLREECAKRGKYSKYLENSGVFKGSVGQLKEI